MFNRPERHPLAALVLITLLAAAVLLQACGGSDTPAPPYTAAIAEGRTAAREILDETGASSLAAALVDGERIIWAEGFGMADKAAGRVATADTLFGIGSVSKMFAATAAMILVEKWGVSLDEPLITYLPDFRMASPEYRDITVRMLLNHSAGLPGGDDRNAMGSAPYTGFAAQVMEGLTYQRLKHAPGYLSVYSNDGFTMVENLVKAVTGMSYPQFVRDQILTPLGMVTSRYNTDYLVDGTYAKTYKKDALLSQPLLNCYATGGLYSSATEMARLAVMLINRGALGSRRILSARSIDAMAQDQTLGSFNPLPTDLFRFGLGWDTVAQPGLGAVGLRAWQKGGDIDGPYGSMYGAALITAPDERLGVVVMGASGVTSSTAAKVAERVLLAALVERGTLPAMPAPLPSTPLPVRAPTAEEKTAYSGFYGASGSLYRVTFLADDSLLLQSRDAGAPGPRFRNMKLRSDGWYATDSDPISAVRFLTRAGRTYLAARVSSGAGHYTSTLLQAQKLDSREPLSAAWQARLGGTWLAANDDAYAAFPDAAPDPRFTFDTLDDLPGYLLIGGTKILCDMTPPASDRANGMFLQIPQVYGRDLVDAAVERRENTDWLRVGSTLYRPLSGVPAAGPGPTTVAIGSEGLAEWRKLPPAGTVAIGGSRAWLLYDADFTRLAYGSGSGSAALPGIGDAAYLMLFGAPGARVTINVNTGQ